MFGIFNGSEFSSVVQWTIGHGYLLMFLAMLVQGPIVTSAAAFAAALGYFNAPIVFALSLLTDVIADIAYYAIGYWGRLKVVDKIGPFFGLSKQRVEKIERLLDKHIAKTILAIKLTPFIPPPGLMLVGALEIPIRRYVKIVALIALPKSLIFTIIGYYFGRYFEDINRYLGQVGAITAAILILSVLYLSYNKIGKEIAKREEDIS